MRTPVLSLLLGCSLGLAASIHGSDANAGSLYVGVGVPIAATVPVVAAVEYDPPVVVGQDYYCCGPGWRGYGWRGYDWRGYGWHDYRASGYVHSGYDHAGYVRGPAARAVGRQGRR